MLFQAEYIWLDGARPTQQLRSKRRVLSVEHPSLVGLATFPDWGFDGSSTNQADGGDSDLVLRPASYVRDPIRGEGNFLVMCEVLYGDGTPHETNHRARLRETLSSVGAEQDPWVGFEQEYTLFRDGRPLGFPEDGLPPAQGPYYCSVGASVAFGRDVSDAHADACIEAGLMIYGTNAEVMPGQWEFQIGYRGVEAERADPLTVADHLWIGRWLLHRIAERFDVTVSFDNKPMKGDWNGAGNHTNFSTRDMRSPLTGLASIRSAVEALEARHDRHIAHYGAGLADRLTGLHETCSIDEFRGGVADRGASIRIPRSVSERGYGYLEDRRPGANSDPYVVVALLIEAICGGASSSVSSEVREPALAHA